MTAPQSTQDLIGSLETAAATLELTWDGQKTPGEPLAGWYSHHSRPRLHHTAGPARGEDTPAMCQNIPMPTELERRRPARPWPAGCAVHSMPPSHALQDALHDSVAGFEEHHLPSPVLGCPLERWHSGVLSVTCVHGDVQELPAVEVWLDFGEGEVVGVIDDLPVPLLIGQDWPCFQKALDLGCHSLSKKVWSWCRQQLAAAP